MTDPKNRQSQDPQRPDGPEGRNNKPDQGGRQRAQGEDNQDDHRQKAPDEDLEE